MEQDYIQSRISWLLNEIHPITNHDDLIVAPDAYESENDTLYLDIMPVSAPRWADTAYQFASHEGMKYDRDISVYGIDGQPRVSFSGMVWARYIGGFEDGSRVALHIWSQQPSHLDAEFQLSNLYRLFRARDGLEPIEVFRKYL